MVTVSSDAHYQANGIDFGAVRRRTRSITGLPEYAVSKLANVLFSQEWRGAPRPGHHHLRAASRRGRVRHLAPGAMARPAAADPAHAQYRGRGAHVRLLRHIPEVGQATGRFCVPRCLERDPNPAATPELAGRLWDHSEAWTNPA